MQITVSSEPLFDVPLSPLIYGDFIEFINDLIPGMWAEKLQDRSFEGVLQPSYVWPPGQDWLQPRWQPFVSGRLAGDRWPDQPQELEMVDAAVRFERDPVQPFVGRQSARVEVTEGSGRGPRARASGRGAHGAASTRRAPTGRGRAARRRWLAARPARAAHG